MEASASDQAFRKQSGMALRQRQPLSPAESNNAVASCTRQVSSRYKSPSPSTVSARRCLSPNISRTSSQLVQKRALSAERKRPSPPSSPARPSTPANDLVDMQTTSRKAVASRLGETLWPSTMRSLTVSFQSDSISVPSDPTLRPSSNVVAHKLAETSVSRNPISDRNTSPLKGKNASDRSENSKPVDVVHTRLIDQHRWPSRIGGKVSSKPVNRSMDIGEKAVRTPAAMSGIGLSSARRPPSSDGFPGPLQKSSSDAERLMKQDRSYRRGTSPVPSAESSAGSSLSIKLASTSFLDRMVPASPSVRSLSVHIPASRQPSPSRIPSPSVSRGVGPARARSSTSPARVLSPSRVRPSSPTNQTNNASSVLSFIVDVRKEKKTAGYMEEVHQLRLLHNRHLQWRFANAQAEAVNYNQKVTAEKSLYDVWTTTLNLWDSVIRKRIALRQMRLELKLKSSLNTQMGYLDAWALLERDHVSSLLRAGEDLEASTLRLPVTAGARAEIDTLKSAVGSALDVMQATGISVRPLLSRVEKMNTLISELAIVSAHERSMLNECDALLASTSVMQVEEQSLKTHILQVKKEIEKGSNQFWQAVMPP